MHIKFDEGTQSMRAEKWKALTLGRKPEVED